MDQTNRINVWLNKHCGSKKNVSHDNINYIFDLIYNSFTASSFINQYDDLILEKKLIDEIDTDRKLQAVIKRVIEQELWKNNYGKKSINSFDKEYRIGDIVKITYYPESQRYIEYYQDQSFIGRIIFIDDKNDNAFFVVVDDDNKNNVTVKSLEREGCHYLGMSRGYSYFIE